MHTLLVEGWPDERDTVVSIQDDKRSGSDSPATTPPSSPHSTPPSTPRTSPAGSSAKLSEAGEPTDTEVLFPSFDDANRFVVTAELGCGGFGRVLAARDGQVGELFAIKIGSGVGLANEAKMLKEILKEDPSQQERIAHIREAFTWKVSETITHQCITFSLSAGGSVYDMQESAGGGSFHRHTICQLLYQVTTAIAFCHRIGLVHGDIKPENMLLGTVTHAMHEQGGIVLKSIELKLADFGCTYVAATLDPSKYQSGTTVMLAPERLLRLASGPAGDMWALGLTLLEWVCGFGTLSPLDALSHGEILNTMEKLVKEALPEHMRQVALLQCYGFKEPLPCARGNGDRRWSRRPVSTMISRSPVKLADGIERLIPYTEPEMRHFQSLGKKLLKLDPARRITSTAVLDSPLFTRGNY
ncbi:kinase-like domain-containing protein [Auriculariales sp. MPI-PUGE-AT-0066]|nr:kinase-like domain-containing protein [Auriculariales sp. MPI-PUGE-AT-0066]